ncbi:hypothetical protein [Pseudomonas sp. 37 R 15]
MSSCKLQAASCKLQEGVASLAA